MARAPATVTFVLLAAAACADAPGPSAGPTTDGADPNTTAPGESSGSGPADTTAVGTTGSTGNPGTTDAGSTDAAEGTGGPVPSGWDPALAEVALRCKLVSGDSLDDPTENNLHTRFNLRGTDLGIPLQIDDQLHLFFGDTTGYRGIWPFGEDPDSVGYTPAAAVAADPTTLCDALAFYVTPDIPSVAAGIDPAIERDFAGGSMNPPAGEPLSNYITEQAGPFPNIPGSFEVPSGALAIDDTVYLTWAGKSVFSPYPRMTLSYLVRWDLPRTSPAYQIIRPIDALADGALGGHFIQIAPIVEQDTVYMFGTGAFRHSGVYLARVPTAALESGAGQAVYDPAAGAWIDPAPLDFAARAAIVPLFESDGVGELSVVFVTGADVYVMLYQRELHNDAGSIIDNRVVLRTASRPEGPWSEPVTVIDMADPAFTAAHCCGPETCPGDQILHCDRAGLYGTYLLPSPAVRPAGDGTVTLSLAFVASTWDPYNVVLFGADVVLSPIFE